MPSSATDSADRNKRNSTEKAVKQDSGKTGKTSNRAIEVERHFSSAEVHPFDQLKWENRTATITDENGEVVFEQNDVEVPKNFSQLATKVVVSKYF